MVPKAKYEDNVGYCKHCKEPIPICDCSRITQDKDKKAVLMAQCQEHLRSMLADQDLERSLNIMSESSSSDQCKLEGGCILKIDIDGMDQAKWTCPCNLESSKKLETLWKPQLSHCLGCHGKICHPPSKCAKGCFWHIDGVVASIG